MKSKLEAATGAVQRLSAKQAWHYRSLPFKEEDNHLHVYVDQEGTSTSAQEELALVLGAPLKFVPVDSAEITSALAQYYRATTQSARIERVDTFFDELLAEALHLNASDIHLEVLEKRGRVRLRIDGALAERYEVPLGRYSAIVNQVKVRAGLDISQKRLPQDGRITYDGGPGEAGCDVRVSVLPTLFGEKVVLRLLNRDAITLELPKLGMVPVQLQAFREGLASKTGLVFVSGPTGSGKTTSLYAGLSELNGVERNLVTIEDPIEYTLDGVNQVQLHETIGLTFPEAMRAFLRQDPNVLMVGEVRDVETATMAVRLSLTGHLVLSTIHTNSAWGIVTRLTDMGVEPYLLADTLRVAVAQRLVRRLCPSCKVEKAVVDLPTREVELLKRIPKKVSVPLGCASCQFTGYKGRIAVHEVIKIDEAAAKAIRERRAHNEIPPGGTLSDRLSDLVWDGVTSLREVVPWLLARE